MRPPLWSWGGLDDRVALERLEEGRDLVLAELRDALDLERGQRTLDLGRTALAHELRGPCHGILQGGTGGLLLGLGLGSRSRLRSSLLRRLGSRSGGDVLAADQAL